MPLDMKREHELHGAGAGKDIIFQIDDEGVPRLYNRSAQELEWDLKSLREKGYAITDDLRIAMAEAEAVRAEMELQLRLQQVREEAVAREMDRIRREREGFDREDDDFDTIPDLSDLES